MSAASELEVNEKKRCGETAESEEKERIPRKVVLENDTIEVTETLFGLNLSVERGKLVGVCGSVGAGKSSLVSAICGDVS